MTTIEHWRRLATELENEAVYYAHRADQEQAALGSGYYPDLLRDMASRRAGMATAIRAHHTVVA